MNKNEIGWFKNWIRHHLEFEDENLYKISPNYCVSVVVENYGEIQIEHDMRVDIGSEFFIIKGRETENWYISYEALIAFKIQYYDSPIAGTEYDRRQEIHTY